MKKELKLAMLAPSFVADFEYPEIIHQLRCIGFDKIVELTFGAKLVNKEYHRILEKPENLKKLRISSVCPGVADYIEKNMPEYKEALIKADSPMIATAKICKKEFPKHKIVFISPCYAKKEEACKKGKGAVDEVITYNELRDIIKNANLKKCLKEHKQKLFFDKFYNDFTKIYPLAGGLSKTAHIKGILKPEETRVIDGIGNVKKFLENPEKGIRFLDANFCVGGCIGGPCLNQKQPLPSRKKKVLAYVQWAMKERIPENRKGLYEKAKGIKFAKE